MTLNPRFSPNLALALVAFPLLSAAQDPAAPVYRYEVVSIHKSAPDQRNSGFSPGAQGGLRARNDTIQMLLRFAYDIREYQVVGLPDWALSDRYDLELTPEGSEITVGPN